MSGFTLNWNTINFGLCLSAVYYCCVLWMFTNPHFVIIYSFKHSDIGCIKKIVYYFPTCDRKMFFVWNFYNKIVRRICSNIFWHSKIRLGNKSKRNVLFSTSVTIGLGFLLLNISAIISKAIDILRFFFGFYSSIFW